MSGSLRKTYNHSLRDAVSNGGRGGRGSKQYAVRVVQPFREKVIARFSWSFAKEDIFLWNAAVIVKSRVIQIPHADCVEWWNKEVTQSATVLRQNEAPKSSIQRDAGSQPICTRRFINRRGDFCGNIMDAPSCPETHLCGAHSSPSGTHVVEGVLFPPGYQYICQGARFQSGRRQRIEQGNRILILNTRLE